MKTAKKVCGIYKITNSINNKIYIGSSIDLYQRKGSHFSSLKHNSHHNTHLQYSYNKHGKQNFIFDVIKECTIEELLLREQHYIDALKPEYNKLLVAGSSLGRKFSEEHKKNMSLSQLKRFGQTEKKRYIKIGRKNNGERLRQYWLTNKPLCKKVSQYNKAGEFIVMYESIAAAAVSIGKEKGFTNIIRCCKSKIPSAYGFIWKYT